MVRILLCSPALFTCHHLDPLSTCFHPSLLLYPLSPSLPQGRFQQPWPSRSPAVNVIGRSPSNGLVAAGGEDGFLECFDGRQLASVARMDVGGAVDAAEEQVGQFKAH